MKYGVLIAEPSLEFRMAIKHTIQKTPPFELFDSAIREDELYTKIKDRHISLVVLGNDFCAGKGLDILQNIAKERRLPIVFVSADYGQTAMAYENGAATFLLKTNIGEPMTMFEKRLKSSLKQILPQVKEQTTSGSVKQDETKEIVVEPKHHPDELLSSRPAEFSGRKIVAIGASTGGVEALSKVLTKIPLGLPPIVVVQHIPLTFSKNFVARLNLLCKTSVVEAKNGEVLNDSTIYFAPADSHLIIDRTKQGRYAARVVEGNKISRHRPSVDILFRSVNNCAGSGAMGVIMTGMGDDGTIGVKELSNSGAYTIAQNEASSVVYGMAQSAVKADAIKKIVDLDEIASEIIAFCNNERNII
jgi:two-component system, chemotaxis family, protein-glutamate methylesterase/glutaminase